MRQALIVGGGICGLAAALACTRAGWEARLFERAATFGEVGAGLQLGPNATRRLAAWGLADGLRECAAFPDWLSVRSAASDRELAALELGAAVQQRHGGPYATLHRADLHALLLGAVRAQPGVWLHAGHEMLRSTGAGEVVILHGASGPPVEGELLIGADGLWSALRQDLLGDGAPRRTGHLAYRALLRQADLPPSLRSGRLTAWLGHRLHAVRYPVRGGSLLNVAVLVEGDVAQAGADWERAGDAPALRAALAGSCAVLQDLAHATDDWRVWALCDRPPLQRPEQLAQGRVALLGDAAHPMLPYLAQGAAMALEDADELGRALAMDAIDPPTMLRRYALNRWRRAARVQAHSRRNGVVFHARGPLRWGRDLALGVLGARLLDMPWLYRG